MSIYQGEEEESLCKEGTLEFLEDKINTSVHLVHESDPTVPKILVNESWASGPSAPSMCYYLLGHVSRLNITGSCFEHLPEVFGTLLHLHVLNASGNNLTDLPASLGSHKNMREVKLDNNKFKRIPDVLFSMQCLTSVSLSHNLISEIEEFPINWSRVRVLDLSDNAIVNIPPSIANLKRLAFFKAFNCAIGELPESIGRLRKLQAFGVTDNKLSKIPLSISRCKNLTLLHIAGNRFKSLPKALFEHRSLQRLAAHDNLLERIPDDIDPNKSLLQQIDLSCNQLTRLPIELARLPTLTWLKLNNNFLKHLPFELIHRKQIFLFLHENPWEQDLPPFDKQLNQPQSLLALALRNVVNVSVETESRWMVDHVLGTRISNQVDCQYRSCDSKIPEALALRFVFEGIRLNKQTVSAEAFVCSVRCAKKYQKKAESNRSKQQI